MYHRVKPLLSCGHRINEVIVHSSVHRTSCDQYGGMTRNQTPTENNAFDANKIKCTPNITIALGHHFQSIHNGWPIACPSSDFKLSTKFLIIIIIITIMQAILCNILIPYIIFNFIKNVQHIVFMTYWCSMIIWYINFKLLRKKWCTSSQSIQQKIITLWK